MIMTDGRARAEICRVGKSLFDRGYVHATSGNISVKLGAGEGHAILITPTDACLGFLEPQALALVDDQGRHVSGQTPSKTIALHQRIYELSEAAGRPASCIIHTHSTHCVALSLKARSSAPQNDEFEEFFPAITPYVVMKVGSVPLIAYTTPGSSEAVAQVAKAIQSRSIRAVMLERLGPVVWHQSAAHAMAALEELEETAKLVWMCDQVPPALGREQLAQLELAFGVRW